MEKKSSIGPAEGGVRGKGHEWRDLSKKKVEKKPENGDTEEPVEVNEEEDKSKDNGTE